MTTNDSEMPERHKSYENGGCAPNGVEKYLNRRSERADPTFSSQMVHLDVVVPPLVLEFLPTNLVNARFEAALPGHELEHPDSSKYLIHQRNPLIPRLHEVILGIHNDLSSEVVQWDEQARHEQPEQTGDAEQAVQEDGPNHELNGGVCGESQSRVLPPRKRQTHQRE